MSNIQSSVVVPTQPLELSYVSVGGDEVPAATRENAHLLQHAADYQVCVRNLRVSGVGDMIWGAIAFALGYGTLRMNPVNLGLLLLGVILVGVGAWIVIRPSPIGMIFDGVTLLLVATWNLFLSYIIITSARAGSNPGWLPVVALAQIGWGVQRIRNYPRFVNAIAMRPSAATLKWLRELAKATIKSKPKEDASSLQFKRGAEKWKGRLLPEVAIFAMTTGIGGRGDLLVASQDSIVILKEKKKLLMQNYNVTMRIGQRKLKVLMPGESLERLKTWMVSPISDGYAGVSTALSMM